MNILRKSIFFYSLPVIIVMVIILAIFNFKDIVTGVSSGDDIAEKIQISLHKFGGFHLVILAASTIIYNLTYIIYLK